MKIVARTVKGDTNVTLEVSPAGTIASVKAKIKAELSLDSASTIKLIFSGKVLGDDAASLATIGVGESDFLVLMVKKAAAAARAGAGNRAGSSVAPAAAPARPAPTPAPAPGASPGGRATIQNLCDMGFPRDQVIAALKAAFSGRTAPSSTSSTGCRRRRWREAAPPPPRRRPPRRRPPRRRPRRRAAASPSPPT